MSCGFARAAKRAEARCAGFERVVKSNMALFEGASCVICNNSYWLDDERPCIVQSMRGVVDMQVEVVGGSNPTGHHGGVHGGAIAEPMQDLLAVTASLVDASGMVLVPGFYDEAVQRTQGELDRCEFRIEDYKKELCDAGLRSAGRGAELLEKRWLEPTLSVTEIWSSTQSGSDLGGSFRLIPSRVKCNLSIRFVPNQTADSLVDRVRHHLQHEFKKRRSPNALSIDVLVSHQWWSGSRDSNVHKFAEKAIRDVWNTEALWIREGGTMPVLGFLQDTLDVPALQLPIGQASDSAHLPNERLRIVNLHKGVRVLCSILSQFAAL
eukprot:Polyplicarium_translucidae@DN2303_c0_g1_i4.p2